MPQRWRRISQSHCRSNRWWNLGFICECWNQGVVRRCLPESWWELFSSTGKEYWWWNSFRILLRNTKKTAQGLSEETAWNADVQCSAPSWQCAPRTGALLEYFNWELFGHPPYSPNLAPSVYHLFTYVKNWLGSQRFNNNEQLMESVKTWLTSQGADFFETGMQKRIPRYDKCLNSCGDYVER
jgi:hypothetical protein